MLSVNITELRANLLKYSNKAQNGQRLATIVAPLNQKRRAKTELKRRAKTAKIHDITSPMGVQ